MWSILCTSAEGCKHKAADHYMALSNVAALVIQYLYYHNNVSKQHHTASCYCYCTSLEMYNIMPVTAENEQEMVQIRLLNNEYVIRCLHYRAIQTTDNKELCLIYNSPPQHYLSSCYCTIPWSGWTFQTNILNAIPSHFIITRSQIIDIQVDFPHLSD